MSVAATSKLATFPEDWNSGVEAGATFFFDPMHYPFPHTPLTSSTLGPAFGAGFTAAAKELNAPIREVRVRYRNHYRFEIFDMFQPATDDEARELGEKAEATGRAEIGRMLDRWHGEHLPAIQRHLVRLGTMDVRQAAGADLVDLVREVESIHKDLWTIHFRLALPMLVSMQIFDEFHAEVFGGTDADAHALVAGSLSESVKAGMGLSDLALAAQELGLASVFEETPLDTLVEVLNTSGNGRAFLGKLHEYLDDYGLRQDLFELATPTWREDPSFALSNVRSYLRTGHDARKAHAAISREADGALTVARDTIAAYPEAVRGQFEALLQFGRQANFLQEEHNFYIDQQGLARLRLFYLGIGQRLFEAGLLGAADDVFMLYVDELQQAVNEIDDPMPSDRFQSIVRERLNEMEIARSLTPPPFVGEPPAGPPPTGDPMQRALFKFFGGPPQQADEPNQLKGNAGSRGVATGIARVARTLDEATDVLPGEILIAITTMPAWTPLFGVAAAVVTETGGALSHCAIVAREYGIPAVVGAHGATQRIVTGQRVIVDGGAGIVTLDS